MTKLYYIAIYLPREINDEIQVFKKDFESKYGSSKALKNTSHITLLPIFHRNIPEKE